MNWGMMFIYLLNAFHFLCGVPSVRHVLMLVSPLTFYFSLAFIKTSGSLERAICVRCTFIKHELLILKLSVSVLFFGGPLGATYLPRRTRPVVSIRPPLSSPALFMHIQLDTLKACLFSQIFFPHFIPSPQIVRGRFPSYVLLMQFCHY